MGAKRNPLAHLAAGAAALWILTAPAPAATVTIQADDFVGVSFGADPALAELFNGTPALHDAVRDGSDLLAGQLVFAAYTNKTDAELKALQMNVLGLYNSFTIFGMGRIGDNRISPSTQMPETGTFDKTLLGDTTTLEGKQIYLFFLGSSDTSTVPRALETAFQVGVFYLAQAAEPRWAFPPQNPLPPFTDDTTIDIADLTVGGMGVTRLTEAQGAHVVLGDFGKDTPDNLPGGGKNFSLVSVPEPGSAALALAGGAMMTLRRRRR